MLRIFSLPIILISLITWLCPACIEDSVSASPGDQPSFSTDTLDMGVIFTEQVSPTARLTVYNRANKGISISRIALLGADADCFRLNVDGFSGKEFSDVEIRANDSIFVLVSTTLPANGLTVPSRVEARLSFMTNGQERGVVIGADGRDAVRLQGLTISEDATFRPGKPYIVYDSLKIEQGATLTLLPGTELLFHQGAYMRVDGTLLSLGRCGREVTLAGDRTGNVAADISFDLMSRQWEGIFFGPASGDSRMEYTHVRNTTYGVQVEGPLDPAATAVPSLTLINSRLRNSGGNGLAMIYANLRAFGTEIAEAAGASLLLWGGDHVVNQCTLSNNYLFAIPADAILSLVHISPEHSSPFEDEAQMPYTKADISNTIIYGMNADLSHGDLSGTGIFLRRCLLKSVGTDDDNFTDCLWDCDPMFRTVRSDYLFDYRLQPESPAIAQGFPQYLAPEATLDRYGNPRGLAPDLGAYVFTPDAPDAQ